MTLNQPQPGDAAPGQAARRIRLALESVKPALVAGLGGFVTILILATLSTKLGAVLLIAPFGASCVLVFALPQSPLAQPRNVIGGHLISAATGLSIFYSLGGTPLAFATGVGLAIMFMSLAGMLHPPAGADPVVVIAAAAHWSFLFVPVLAGTVLIVLAGLAFHRLVSGRIYPVPA